MLRHKVSQIGLGILPCVTRRFFYGLVIHSLTKAPRPKVRRLLMTYIIDLTTVLKSLSDVLTRMSRSSAGISWLELKEAFDAYEHSGDRQRIHHRISLIFQQDQQISNADSFRRVFRELAEDAKVPAPVATSASMAAPTSAPGATLESASGQSRRRRVRFPCLCA
jgi:hypothetical protein